jgi:hypothetical protein
VIQQARQSAWRRLQPERASARYSRAPLRRRTAHQRRATLELIVAGVFGIFLAVASCPTDRRRPATTSDHLTPTTHHSAPTTRVTTNEKRSAASPKQSPVAPMRPPEDQTTPPPQEPPPPTRPPEDQTAPPPQQPPPPTRPPEDQPAPPPQQPAVVPVAPRGDQR